MSFNKTILVGNMTRDVELRYTPKGTAVGNFSLAVNRTWVNEAGEKQEDCSFIECQVWGRSAENLAQYVRKGHAVLVEGRLKQDTWEDKETGKKRSKVYVVVESFSFLNNRGVGEGKSSDEPRERPQSRPTQAAQSPAHEPAEPFEDDTIPF